MKCRIFGLTTEPRPAKCHPICYLGVFNSRLEWEFSPRMNTPRSQILVQRFGRETDLHCCVVSLITSDIAKPASQDTGPHCCTRDTAHAENRKTKSTSSKPETTQSKRRKTSAPQPTKPEPHPLNTRKEKREHQNRTQKLTPNNSNATNNPSQNTKISTQNETHTQK